MLRIRLIFEGLLKSLKRQVRSTVGNLLKPAALVSAPPPEKSIEVWHTSEARSTLGRCDNPLLDPAISTSTSFFRRSQIIDELLTLHGLSPEFYALSPEEGLAVGSELLRRMNRASLFDPTTDPGSER